MAGWISLARGGLEKMVFFDTGLTCPQQEKHKASSHQKMRAKL